MAAMTQRLEDYLEAMYCIHRGGQAVQVSDVARHVGVKKPSVVKAIRELKALGLVVQEPYGDIELTAKGRRVAGLVLNRHRLLMAFLEKLGVSRRIADRDACRMEHILSAETIDKIRTFNEGKA